MRNAKVMNDALDQLHAQVWAIFEWVVTLAALTPHADEALAHLPDAARAGLLFQAQPDDQIERCVAALQAMNDAMHEVRAQMPALSRPKPPG
jgi:hypothetical protein